MEYRQEALNRVCCSTGVNAKTRWIFTAMMILLVVLVGQASRELLPPDDLREAEVGREMYVGEDYVIPHLAGRPFVEKPPAFPAVIALVYSLTGGPSMQAARFVSISFALAALAAVFLAGRNVLGTQGGLIAAVVLAFSSRFCRAAHGVHIDIALTAAMAFALHFTWKAQQADDSREKAWGYAETAFCLAVAFLLKGLVGPALYGTGFLLYLLSVRRFSELRHWIRPMPVAAFLLPVLLWMLPFMIRATPDQIWEFFVRNHFGRFFSGYESNLRAGYYYLVDLMRAFLPASLLLPFAVFSAWRRRTISEGRASLFFLSMATGPLLLLSFSKGKDSIYLLPAYPAFALLVADWYFRNLQERGREGPFRSIVAWFGGGDHDQCTCRDLLHRLLGGDIAFVELCRHCFFDGCGRFCFPMDGRRSSGGFPGHDGTLCSFVGALVYRTDRGP